MQVLTLIKAVSVALAAGALSFLLAEWRIYRNAFGDSKSLTCHVPDTGRLLRRSFGSAVLLAMSILMFLGRLPDSGQSSPEEVLSLFYYWSAIVGLAMVLAVTALYDALRGVKRLGNYVSAMEGRELARLAKQLKEAEREGAPVAADSLETS